MIIEADGMCERGGMDMVLVLNIFCFLLFVLEIDMMQAMFYCISWVLGLRNSSLICSLPFLSSFDVIGAT